MQQPYYYTVREVAVPDGYEKTDATWSTSGTITITNTLKTINITANKVWNTNGKENVTKPEISIRLQRKNGENWENVSEIQAVTLNEANNWTYKFTNIPEGTYRIKETRVPTGWTAENDSISNESSTNGDTLTITNTLQTGSLKITKNWIDSNESDRPGSVKVKIYRSAVQPTQPDVIPPSSEKYETVTEDYARLLQYSLYFYDANECGNDVDDNILYWRNNCYTNDAVPGGYHDAGDHVMFGLPQGFTASTLGWTYYEYKDSFEKLGLTAHYKDIMDRFCDFFKKSTTLDSGGNVTKLLIEKGEGDTDHSSYWGPPEFQQSSQRGRLLYSDSANSGSNIAADYAAALAQYYLNFPDDPNAAEYLKYAKALYAYAWKLNNAYSATGFYADSSCTDELAWGAAWLALATGDTQYLTDCKQYLDSFHNNEHSFDIRGHFWGEPALGAEIVYNSYLADSPNWSNVDNYLKNTCTGDGFKQLNKWGTTRHNTLLQLCALTTDKHKGTKEYKIWCQNQMNYILGKNHFNVCFVVGFANNSPKAPHHEAASGCDNWGEYENYKNNRKNCDHVLIGALVGGPHNEIENGPFNDDGNGSFTYEDWIDNSVDNEVALDYNAGLVGAAAALYSVYGTGNTVSESVMIADGLELKEGKHIYEQVQAKAARIAPKMIVPDESTNVADVVSSVKALSASMVSEDLTLVGAGDNTIVFDSSTNDTDFNNMRDKDSYDISHHTSGKTITKIVVQMANSQTNFKISLNKQTIYGNGNIEMNGNILTIEPTNNQFIATWDGSNVDNDKINDMAYYNWNNTVKSITLYCEVGDSFTVTPSLSDLVVGDKFTLNAENAEGTVNWTFDTNMIQANDDGTFTAIKSGDGISISGKDGDGKNGACTINVSDLQINKSNVTLTVGDTETLTITNGSKDNSTHTFTWSSEDESVVTVDSNGKITAKSANNKKITLTKDGEYTANCNVTVNSLQISRQNPNITFGVGVTDNLTVSGQTDGHNFEWESSNPKIVEVDANNGQM